MLRIKLIWRLFISLFNKMIYVQLSEITCIESLIIRGCIILVFSTNFVLFCLLQSLGMIWLTLSIWVVSHIQLVYQNELFYKVNIICDISVTPSPVGLYFLHWICLSRLMVSPLQYKSWFMFHFSTILTKKFYPVVGH